MMITARQDYEREQTFAREDDNHRTLQFNATYDGSATEHTNAREDDNHRAPGLCTRTYVLTRR